MARRLERRRVVLQLRPVTNCPVILPQKNHQGWRQDIVSKTTTAQRQAKSEIWIQDPDHREQYEATAQSAPSMSLAGAKPRLIDEWQGIPELWDSVRMAVDRSDDVGQYILTGSTVISHYRDRYGLEADVVLHLETDVMP